MPYPLRVFTPLLLAVLLMWETPAMANGATTPEDIVLQLKWRHQFQFAGYYAAVHKGFYRDEGLNVVLREGGPGIAPHEEVLGGQADYGIGGGDLVYHWLQDRPVVALAAIYQHSPTTLLTLGASNLATPHDLAGKRVGMLVGGQPDTEIAAMLVNEGIALDTVHMTENAPDLKALLTHGMDADITYLTNEPYALRQHGIPFNLIRPINYGVDFYGDTLFTSVRELHDHPDRTAAFVRASLKGWAWALNHVDETIDIILNHYSTVHSAEQLQYEAAQTRKLMLPEIVEIGHMNPGRWQAMATTFSQLGMAPAGKTLDGFLYEPEKKDDSSWLWWSLGALMSIAALALPGIGLLTLFNMRLRKQVDLRTKTLSAEIEKRKQAEALLENQNQELEKQVKKRTLKLTEEIAEHQQAIRKLAETTGKLRQARQAAMEASRTKSRFLANMSHEIRTPLNAIVGINHLLRQTSLDVQQKEWIEIQDNASRMLLGIISNILDFSKIESGKLELEKVNFELRRVLQHVGGLFSSDADIKGLTLSFNIDDSLPDCVNGDPLRIGQVLSNLIGNAIKFTENGSVSVSVHVIEHKPETVTLHFSIRDTGIGISADKIGRLFEPFDQSDISFSRRFGGSGLGLAISSRLLNEMGAELECNSVPDVGSTFDFSLTLDLCSETKATSPLPTHSRRELISKTTALTSSHVLLVEDDDINRLIAEKMLESIGVGQITCSESAEHALKILQDTLPDAILMDIQMPGMDGYQATARIRKIYGDAIPIIALTASAVAGERQRCLAAGMDDYISKPIDPEHLTEVLLSWVGNSGTEKMITNTIDNLKTKLGTDNINEVLTSAVDALARQKEEIASLLGNNKWNEAAKLAHRMRGATAIYGGEHIATLLRAVEKSQGDDRLDIQHLAAELDTELEKAIRAIRAALGTEKHHPD